MLPIEFAEQWVQAWNDRDFDTVLRYYSDNVVFTSPTVAKVVPDSYGTVRGKRQLQEFWQKALELNSDLHFDLCGVYAGIGTIVLHYRNQKGLLINEILTFQGDLVIRSHATHLRRQRKTPHRKPVTR